MRIIYSDEPYISLEPNSIFLAGPTPRSADVPSWRPEAIEILKKLDFDGTVLIPEWKVPSHGFDYDQQIQWEFQGLINCGKVVIWVPSDPDKMPALTTRTEFGMFLALRPNDVLYGRPEGAWKTSYMDWWSHKIIGEVYHDLEGLLLHATRQLEYACIEKQKPEQYFQV